MSRPYRLYDAKRGQFLRWRYYSVPRNAHNGALVEVKWAQVGTVIELVNHESGRVLATYKKSATGTIHFS